MRSAMICLMGGLLMLTGLFGNSAAAGSAHDFSFESIDGKPMALKDFAGKPVLIVNTASQCGFTDQYAGLQALYQRYQSRGLVVIGVPSNDFGAQEPGTAEQIQEFCETNFDVTFPMTQKYAVTGDQAHGFYKWAGEQVGALGRPRWNFHKYLIGPDGQLTDWYSTVTEPDGEKVRSAVEALLAKP